MVTILSLAFTSPTRMEQERCTSSLMCTEQAPHCATPQPYFVPVRPSCSRMTHKSGVSASASTSRVVPLILSFVMGVLPRGSVATNVAVVAWPADQAEQIRELENAAPVTMKSSLSEEALPMAASTHRTAFGQAADGLYLERT